MFSIPMGIYLGVELLGQMVILFLTLWGTAKVPSNGVSPFHIPTMYEGSNFSTSPSKFRHTYVADVVSHCGFDLHFPVD